MRKAIIILLLCIPFAVNAATYYVAINGNDSNPGTLAQPWATWQKGFSSISPGDILYIRGGTYLASSTTGQGGTSTACGVYVNGKRGSSSNQYQVFNYPGEVPILDCRNLTASSERRGILLTSSSYWHIKGLELTRVDQSTNGNVGEGLEIYGGNHNLIENCVAHHNGGPGFGTRIPDGDENHFLNCDAYSNYDPYTDTPGDNADGFDIGFGRYGGGDYIIRLTGCRSWNNSDDGYDMYQYSGYSAIYYLKDCWAWHNGYKSDGVSTAGDGNGFKYGLDGQSYSGVTKRYSYNCIAYNNRQRGFTQESARVKKEFINCTSYMNKAWGFSFGWPGDASAFEVADIVKNNIAFGDGVENIHGGTFYATRTSEGNSWDAATGVSVSAADFLSTDGQELVRSRNEDGSLPEINFLHLAAGSDLIDKGVNAGLPYAGNAPDLGSFEQGTSGTSATVPVYNSSVVENSSPALLVMTYDIALNTTSVPMASSFSVLVNSAARTVNSVAISGNKVQLTLSAAIKYGDIVKLSYTKPLTKPLLSTSGGLAISVSAKAVTNNLNAPATTTGTSMITMTLTPSPVHRFISILFAYASTFSNQDPAVAPQVLKILDLSGNLLLEKLLVTGVSNIKFPVNLRRGIYIVTVALAGEDVATQKMIVY
jgi:uncharacterized repeat protein (TIGR02059 family)